MYPALAVLQALSNRADSVLWVGGEGGMEGDLVTREQVPFQAIPAAGVHGVSIKSLPGNIIRLVRGYFASRRLLRQFNPDVLFFTGGYVAVPMALAGIKRQSLLYVPDIEPGLALKTIARYSDHIALTAETSRSYFPKKQCTVTGYPTRQDLSRWSRDAGREFLKIKSTKPVLLVFGGSKGARSINLTVTSQIESLLDIAEVVHISGNLDWSMVQDARSRLSEEQQSQYHIFPYLHEMGAALSAADLVISRAGASTLGEYPQFGLPAILIPYPYAWRYQKVNADHLASHGAAVILENDQLPESLVNLARDLLSDSEKLEKMRMAVKELEIKDSAHNIAELLASLAQKKGSEGRNG